MGAAATPPTTATVTGSASTPGFVLPNPAFVDFGCGTGGSMRFAEKVMRGPGVGIDTSGTAVEACTAAGLEAHACDMLAFDQRGCAQASFAIDSLTELGNRAELERAFLGLLRAARDFTVIQHPAFDADEALLARGLFATSSFVKSIRCKPRIADYVHLVSTHRRSLNLVGLAIFGYGEATTVPVGLPGLEAGGLAAPQGRGWRTLRVIVARKDSARFRFALQRAATGEALVMWEAPA